MRVGHEARPCRSPGKRAEGRAQRRHVAIVDGCVEQRKRRAALARVERVPERRPRRVTRPLGPRERRPPPRQILLALRVHHRPHPRPHLRVRGHVPQRRRQRLARPGRVEHHRAHQRHEAPRVARASRAPAPHERAASVGRRRVHLVEQRSRARRVPAQQPRLRPPRRDRRGLVVRRPLEPQLGPRPVALREIQIRQLEQRVAPRLAPRLGHRQRPHERVAHVVGARARRPPGSPQAHPHLGPRRRALGPAPRASSRAPRRGRPPRTRRPAARAPAANPGALAEHPVRRRARAHRVALRPAASCPRAGPRRRRRGRPPPCRSSGR